VLKDGASRLPHRVLGGCNRMAAKGGVEPPGALIPRHPASRPFSLTNVSNEAHGEMRKRLRKIAL
jgi:hypothetical protein